MSEVTGPPGETIYIETGTEHVEMPPKRTRRKRHSGDAPPDRLREEPLTIRRPPEGAPSQMLEVIERLAPTVSVETLERMMALYERNIGREAREAFAADFVRMKPHLPRVVKTHDNTQTNSRYAKLEDINQVIDPVLEQYHFGTATKVIAQTADMITVQCELWHSLGHTEFTTLSMPPDDSGIAGKVNKTRPHAIASTITYLKRVGICALLNISTGDDTDGNLPGAKITEEQVAKIVELMKQAAVGPRFLKYMKAPSVEEAGSVEAAVATIAARDYRKAITTLDEQIAKKSSPTSPPEGV